MNPVMLAALLSIAISQAAYPKELRSTSEVRAFKRQQPCPSTGQRRGACPGYVVDHVVPLCAGGADHRRNMQWQTVRDGLLKDREERRECRALRRSSPS